MKLKLDWLGIALVLVTMLFAAAAFKLVTHGHQWEGFFIALITALGFMAGHDYLMFR